MNLRLCVTILLAVLLQAAVSGQGPTATLVGVVIDAAGRIVPKAKLEIQNMETNETRRLESDANGEFTAPNLAPGKYEVVVTKEGFHRLREKELVLEIDQTARMEFRLEVGSVNQSVEVTAAVPLINTENAVKGFVMVSQEIVEMPLNGRDFSDLAFLTPGVTQKASGGQGSNFNINGARADNTNFIIDGFNDQNPRGAAIQVQPNLDALEEFKMQTTGYSAEYGRLAGGVMNMVLKSGTNQLHGAAFYFARNDVFDARNFFDAQKSPLERNQFGGTLTGPVVIPKVYNGRNRTFFLFSWESYRQTLGENKLGILPTTEQKRGDFSAIGLIKDPLATGACTNTTRTACFPNNQIPLSRISPVAIKSQQFYAPPNLPGQLNNYRANVNDNDKWDSDVIKFDQRISDKDIVSFRYMKRYNNTSGPFTGSDTGLFGSFVHQHQTLTGATYTRTFSPSIINEARMGFSRTADHETGSLAGTDYNTQFGLPSPLEPKLVGFPRIVITNYMVLGGAASYPVDFTVNNFQWADTMTWVKSRHLIKFGADILRTQFFQPYYNNNRGTFNFTGSWTGQSYADFLLGELNSSSRQVGTTPNYLFSVNYSLFIQDDWKIANHLTLNLGMRYELPKPPSEKYGRYTNFVPEFGKLVIASDATLKGTGITFTDPTKVATAAEVGLPNALTYPRNNDIAPRIGLAWRPFGGNRSVIRGGYGIFYGTALQNPVRNSLANVFPFVISQTFNRVASKPTYLTFADPFPTAPDLASAVTTVNGYEVHAKTPSLQSWNLTAEREIGWQSAIEIGYVGSKGSHLGRQYNLNQPERSASGTIFPYPAFGTMNYYGFNANSSYNAATVILRRRIAGNFFYRFSYTYGKSIDDASQLSGNSDGGYTGAQNVRDLHQDRGRSDWDIGHSVTTSFSWTSPKSSGGFLRNWQLAGTSRMNTGQPFTPQVSNVNLNLGEANRPNRVSKGTIANPGADRWYDVAAFPVVPQGSFKFGNSGRGILDAPGMVQINVSVLRNFFVHERHRVQLRAEIFNILNHANLGVPIVNVNAPNAATITTAGAGRLIQLGIRYSF